MNNQVLFIILCLGAFMVALTRVKARYRYPFALTGDVFFHLLCARAIRDNRMRIPRSVPGFIWDTGYTYPPLYHWVLALFSEHRRLLVERYSSVLFDLIQSSAVFGIAAYLFASMPGVPSDQALWEASAVTAANLLSPVFNAQIWGARVLTGTARPMGEAMFVMGVIAAFFWELEHGVGFAVLAAILFGLLPLVSKFSVQVLAAFFLFLALFAKWSWLLLIGGGVLIVWAVSTGLTGRVLMGHYHHSLFYFSFLQDHYYGLKRGQSGFFGMREYLQRCWENLKKLPDFKAILTWFVGERNFYHVMLFYNLHLWVIILVFLIDRKSAISSVTWGNTLLLLALSPLLPALLTSFPKLRFLGESYRYFEYYQWVYWLLLMVLSPQLFMIVAGIAMLLSFRLVREAAMQIEAWHHEYLASEPFFAWIREHLKGQSVYPLGGRYYECIDRGGVSILLWPANMRLNVVPIEDLKEIFHSYPFPRSGTGYQKVLRKYAIKYVICHEQNVSSLDPSIFEGLERVETPLCQLRLFYLR